MSGGATLTAKLAVLLTLALLPAWARSQEDSAEVDESCLIQTAPSSHLAALLKSSAVKFPVKTPEEGAEDADADMTGATGLEAKKKNKKKKEDAKAKTPEDGAEDADADETGDTGVEAKKNKKKEDAKAKTPEDGVEDADADVTGATGVGAKKEEDAKAKKSEKKKGAKASPAKATPVAEESDLTTTEAAEEAKESAPTTTHAAEAPIIGAPEAAIIAPFGKEDTARELQSHAARTQDTLVDAIENAEVSEIKRSVFRALTRLRAAEIKEFDTIARLETQAIDEYNDNHHFRQENPLEYISASEPRVAEDKYTAFHG